MYSNMAIKISITEILTEELLMSVLVSSLSSLTLMKKSSPYWQLSTFMLIMSLIIDCMRRYIIQDCFCVSDGTFDDALLISIDVSSFTIYFFI